MQVEKRVGIFGEIFAAHLKRVERHAVTVWRSQQLSSSRKFILLDSAALVSLGLDAS